MDYWEYRQLQKLQQACIASPVEEDQILLTSDLSLLPIKDRPNFSLNPLNRRQGVVSPHQRWTRQSKIWNDYAQQIRAYSSGAFFQSGDDVAFVQVTPFENGDKNQYLRHISLEHQDYGFAINIDADIDPLTSKSQSMLISSPPPEPFHAWIQMKNHYEPYLVRRVPVRSGPAGVIAFDIVQSKMISHLEILFDGRKYQMTIDGEGANPENGIEVNKSRDRGNDMYIPFWAVQLDKLSIPGLSISDDGKYAIVTDYNHYYLVDRTKGKAESIKDKNRISDLCGRDGGFILFSQFDRIVKINASNPLQVSGVFTTAGFEAICKNWPEFSGSYAVNRDRSKWLVATSDRKLKCFDSNASLLWSVEGRDFDPIAIGKTIAVRCQNGGASRTLISIYDVNSGKVIREISLLSEAEKISISPDDKMLAISGKESVIINISTANLVACINDYTEKALFSPDGKWAVFTGNKLNLLLLHDESNVESFCFRYRDYGSPYVHAWDAAFTSDSKEMYVGYSIPVFEGNRLTTIDLDLLRKEHRTW